MTKHLLQTPSTGKHQVYLSAPELIDHVWEGGEKKKHEHLTA